MRRLAAVSGSRDDLTTKERHMASVAATRDLSALRDPDDREQRGLELQAMLHELRQTHVKDGIAWRIGGERDLQWIRGATGVARQITAAIRPVFADHATLVHPGASAFPRDVREERQWDLALVEVLRRHAQLLPWWLGYLDTGASDIVFWDTPTVTLYTGWHDVLIEAGPRTGRDVASGSGREETGRAQSRRT
jgi:hypothetical protein